MAIPLTQGKVAIIELCDYGIIGKFRWQAKKMVRTWYAKRAGRVDGKKRDVFMHDVLCPVPSGMVVDHQDRDGLNNRRTNLRPATHLQNNMNRVVFNNPSGYKGVRSSKKRWRATIGIKGERISLGSFATAQDAARVYNQAARQIYGEFTKLNEVS